MQQLEAGSRVAASIGMGINIVSLKFSKGLLPEERHTHAVLSYLKRGPQQQLSALLSRIMCIIPASRIIFRFIARSTDTYTPGMRLKQQECKLFLSVVLGSSGAPYPRLPLRPFDELEYLADLLSWMAGKRVSAEHVNALFACCNGRANWAVDEAALTDLLAHPVVATRINNNNNMMYDGQVTSTIFSAFSHQAFSPRPGPGPWVAPPPPMSTASFNLHQLLCQETATRSQQQQEQQHCPDTKQQHLEEQGQADATVTITITKRHKQQQRPAAGKEQVKDQQAMRKRPASSQFADAIEGEPHAAKRQKLVVFV
ncbi:hypothetical protein COO60DRAFT_1644278 [Scenedesmus sp. NREL 46B-D3]|nr:hypothetical protein COO60DRAFT_1644278 [Scenedesmus sp. NREL 46B-D3]